MKLHIIDTKYATTLHVIWIDTPPVSDIQKIEVGEGQNEKKIFYLWNFNAKTLASPFLKSIFQLTDYNGVGVASLLQTFYKI